MNLRGEASVLLAMAGKDIDLLRYIVSSDLIADEIFGFTHINRFAALTKSVFI